MSFSNANILNDIVNALLGGVLIGYASSSYLLSYGKICGVSGILYSTIKKDDPIRSIKIGFIVGLFSVGYFWKYYVPPHLSQTFFIVTQNYWKLAAAGLLVGVGTSLGGGCTSGHGICGVARLSPRGLVATGCFMATGILTVLICRLVGI